MPAIQALNGINLSGNQLIAALLENLGSDPGTFTGDGRVFYRTDIDKLRARINGAWENLATESYIDTLDYVDDTELAAAIANALNGQDWKESVRVASIADVDLVDAPAAIDGVTLASGDRVLLKDQTADEENGIYVYDAEDEPLVRADDADTSAEVTAGMTVIVAAGGTNADTVWILTTNDAIVLDTTPLTFTQMPGGSSYLGGDGLTLTGNSFAVNVDGSSLEISADALRVKALGITNAMLAGSIDLTTKVTGVLPIANGGTNANTAATARTNLGATTKVAGDVTGDGSDTSLPFTHSLGTKDIVVAVYEATSDEEVLVNVVRTDTNNIMLNFGIAPANAKVYRVVVVG